MEWLAQRSMQILGLSLETNWDLSVHVLSALHGFPQDVLFSFHKPKTPLDQLAAG